MGQVPGATAEDGALCAPGRVTSHLSLFGRGRGSDGIQMLIRFIVPGVPQAKQRARTVRDVRHEGRSRTYTPEETVTYEQVVGWAAKAAARGIQTIEGPVALRVVFSRVRPKRCEFAYPCGRPDLDNFVKSIMDGINQAGIWRDDSQVVKLETAKVYGEQSFASVSIEFSMPIDVPWH